MAEETEFQKLWQLQAVREAVLGNLQVRIKRDDDKATKAQAKLTEIFKQAWYKNLGGIYPAVQEFIAAVTDLQVTHVSFIKEQELYIADQKKWAAKEQGKTEEVETLRQLNNDLSVQLKIMESQVTRQKKGGKVTPKKEEKAPESADVPIPDVPVEKGEERKDAEQEPTFEL